MKVQAHNQNKRPTAQKLSLAYSVQACNTVHTNTMTATDQHDLAVAQSKHHYLSQETSATPKSEQANAQEAQTNQPVTTDTSYSPSLSNMNITLTLRRTSNLK